MSMRRHNHGDDTSRRHRDVAPAPVPRPSRETIGSSAIATPDSSSSTRGTTYPTSHVRNNNIPSRSLSESHLPRDEQQRVDAERDGAEHRKRSATSLTKDQGSMYSREGEGTKARDESTPPKEEDQNRYGGVSTDDRRNTPRGSHHPSLKDNADIVRPPPAHAKDVQPIASTSASFQQLFEAQSKELSALQHERRATLEEKKALADAYAVLRQQYDERAKKLSAVRHERRAALEQRKEIDGAYATLRQQYEEQTKKLNAVRHERQAALEKRKEIDDAYATLRRQYEEQTKRFNAVRHERQAALEQQQKAEEDYAALRQTYEVQGNEYNTLNTKYHSLKATLEQRTSELQSVQRFLTTVDTFSGSEVVNTLRKLNEEVQQSTTFMAEWANENFMFETPRTDRTAAQSIEETRASEMLGMRFMQLLGAKKHKDNPILVEMAFRAYLIYELYWVASPWSIGEEEQSHKVYLDAIYQRIREAEGQAISGNWRALTRAYTLPACMSDAELAHTIDATIASGFSDVLLTAGCTASKSDITSSLWSKFGEKIRHFVSLAGQVSKIIGVGVISEDFEVLVRWPEEGFDERAMEDSYDNGDRVQGTEEHQETVLCATELGLMQRMKVGASTGQKGKPSELIVIKPKVALVSVIDMIDS